MTQLANLCAKLREESIENGLKNNGSAKTKIKELQNSMKHMSRICEGLKLQIQDMKN